MSYILRIKPLSGREDIIKKLYKNKTGYSDDSGVDLFCLDDQITKKGSLSNTIHFGIMCELIRIISYTLDGKPLKYINCPYMLVPRSSISKTPLRMSNSIGIIDSGYRGEIMAKIDCLGDKDWSISKGISYFQIISPDLRPIKIEIVSELSKTERDYGGFGSTGNTH